MNAHAELRRFTVEEYEKLGETGLFRRDERVELLDGEISTMAPIGKRHAKAVRTLMREMSRTFGDVCLIDAQHPIVLDDFSEPQPDILLLRLEFRESSELPRPADILLIVEVADSTRLHDAGQKLHAYARSGIPEYWIVNLADVCVEIYRQPQGDDYAEHFRMTPGQTLVPLAFPERLMPVADVLS